MDKKEIKKVLSMFLDEEELTPREIKNRQINTLKQMKKAYIPSFCSKKSFTKAIKLFFQSLRDDELSKKSGAAGRS